MANVPGIGRRRLSAWLSRRELVKVYAALHEVEDVLLPGDSVSTLCDSAGRGEILSGAYVSNLMPKIDRRRALRTPRPWRRSARGLPKGGAR